MEIIILAGGFGTRLKSVVKNKPKCLADVNGKPFLSLLIQNLIKQGLNDFIFSLHYQSDQIIKFINNESKDLFNKCKVRYLVEPEPLGTGGAIAYVINNLNISDNFLVINSDTWIGCGIDKLSKSMYPSILTVFLKNTYRYGKLEINSKNFITKFKEKECESQGYINAGAYHLSKKNFKLIKKRIFSIENDLFPMIKDLKAVKVETSFMDIGIPSDYKNFCNKNINYE